MPVKKFEVDVHHVLEIQTEFVHFAWIFSLGLTMRREKGFKIECIIWLLWL